MTTNTNHSPGTASQRILNEIASWTPEEVDSIVTAALAQVVDTQRETTTCIVRGCGAEFFLIPARGDVKHMCLSHGADYMRSNGHQNDPEWSVD